MVELRIVQHVFKARVHVESESFFNQLFNGFKVLFVAVRLQKMIAKLINRILGKLLSGRACCEPPNMMTSISISGELMFRSKNKSCVVFEQFLMTKTVMTKIKVKDPRTVHTRSENGLKSFSKGEYGAPRGIINNICSP